jgi:hypothetical protein
MQFKILIACFFLSSILISCGDDADANNKLVEDKIHYDKEVAQADSIKILNIEDLYKLSPAALFSEGSFKPEYLEYFLPSQIDGFQSFPHSKGEINDGYRLIVTVSGQYSNESKSILTIALRDHSSTGIGTDRNQFENPATEQGISPVKIKGENYIGYMIWDNKENEGYLNVLAGDRFMIRIDGYNCKEKDLPLTRYLEKIKFKN